MDTTIDQLIRLELPAARDGDRAAYGRIVAACQNTVTAIALAIVRDVPSSEDIAQDAFLSAWQHLRRLHNADSFLPWLRQITRNLARDHLRANKRAPFRVDFASSDRMEAAIASAADPAPLPPDALIDEERTRAAAELISALPTESRETLLLFYREGQSSQQVATLLGLTDAAVRKRLSRARQMVRDDLLARFGEFAQSSAPAAGFATIVTSALVLASPPAAAAGIFGTGTAAAAGVGAKAVIKAFAGAAIGIGLALFVVYAAIRMELTKQLKGAVDAEERKALKRSAAINTLASVGYIVGLFWVTHDTQGWIPSVVTTCLFMGTVFWQTAVVQPRAMARRHALEAARDPIGAARRRRSERWKCWLGISCGVVAGFGGLLAGLVGSGRLTF
ncbi:sigma-70 family RNA polymerase sigma factor [Lysobacter sp. A6]|uniref:RNA polymerase sigma factor n=1 Tax=Noviluteimonas lactosilytica TaxID=2888523 RepID=A0ABS8JEU3_9GAMM|nr:sigma-70 family RNA polymerase sigma factor [Lysobacter lactosilyticus]MCC8362116.1 sigma-70 family RNA polymerase sigma factor [Lysobacter lactosilyticus]